MLRLALRRGSLPLSRLVCTPRLKGTKAGGTKAAASAAEAIKQAPEFGTKVASEDSAAQLMHDAQKGKFAYINDFAASLNTGPVKLSFKDAPRTKEDEAQVRALHRGGERGWWITHGAWRVVRGAWCVVRDAWCVCLRFAACECGHVNVGVWIWMRTNVHRCTR